MPADGSLGVPIEVYNACRWALKLLLMGLDGDDDDDAEDDDDFDMVVD